MLVATPAGISSNVIVNHAPSPDTAYLESTQTRVQIVSPSLRRVTTTSQYATRSAALTEVHVCNYGELVLPAAAYVCQIDVINYGVVRGVSNLTECPQSGGYYDASDSAVPSTCGGAAATGVIHGCTDTTYAAYSPLATVDDGTCVEAPPPVGDILGCMYPIATNYNPDATRDDLSCVFGPSGGGGAGDSGGGGGGGNYSSSTGPPHGDHDGASSGGSCCHCADGLANLTALVLEQHAMQREQLELLRGQSDAIQRVGGTNECARFVRGEGEANRTCFMLPADVPDPTDEFQILPDGVPSR